VDIGGGVGLGAAVFFQALGSRVRRCASTRGNACTLRVPVGTVGMTFFLAKAQEAPGSVPKK
jgi:hypothetical protein